MFVELPPERLCGLLLKSMHGTLDAAANLRSDCHEHEDEREMRGWKIQSVFVQKRQQGRQTVLPHRVLFATGCESTERFIDRVVPRGARWE